MRTIKYDEFNVTRGVKENGENPGYFYAPCKYCGRRLNVGNYPPVIIEGKLDVFCFTPSGNNFPICKYTE